MEKHSQQVAPVTETSCSTTNRSSINTAELDAPLHTLGFQFDHLSPSSVSGHLFVTPNCCQPFKVLHGGVSALIAEALASIGAYLASGMKRVAGVHLSIDHIKSAQLGDLVVAQATPLSCGRTLQVWEVRLWKANPSNMKNEHLISSSSSEGRNSICEEVVIQTSDLHSYISHLSLQKGRGFSSGHGDMTDESGEEAMDIRRSRMNDDEQHGLYWVAEPGINWKSSAFIKRFHASHT